MKKRLLALLLVLSLLIAVLPITAAAKATKLYGTVPIYTGLVDLDYMAQEILKEIQITGTTDREKVLEVYNWIILNCEAYGTADKEYFDMDEVMEKSSGAFLEQMEEDFIDGNITFRIDVAGEMGSADGFLPCDSNDYVAWAAYQMMLYRIGQSHNFAGLLTVLLGHLGYDCRLIDGEWINNDGTQGEHKWNMVLLDGKYYWLDVRMDHSNYKRTGKLNHTYFLIEDTDQWEKKHSWDHSYSDAMMERAEQLIEDYGLLLALPEASSVMLDAVAEDGIVTYTVAPGTSTGDATLIVAFYEEEQMKSAGTTPIALTGLEVSGTIPVLPGATVARLFLVDSSGKPLCESFEVTLP